MFIEYDSDRSFRLRVEERNAIYVLSETGARLHKIHLNSSDADEELVRDMLVNTRHFEDIVVTMRIACDIYSIHRNWILVVEFVEPCNYRGLLLQTLRELNR